MRDYLWFKLISNNFYINKMLESINWYQINLKFIKISIYYTINQTKIYIFLSKIHNKTTRNN